MAGRLYSTRQQKRRSALLRRASVLALALALIIFLLGLNGRRPLGAARAPAESGAGRIVSVLSMPVRGAENLSRSVGAHFGTVAENERLAAEVTRLKQVEGQILSLREQVSYLETILNTDIETVAKEKRIAARAVSEVRGPFVQSALINAGAAKGVSSGDAVMTVNGIYGRVVRSGNSSARVLLLTDLSSRIAVMSQRSRGRAILSGDNTVAPSLEFRRDGDWQIGDRIVTSGDDGILPRGLPVGEVFAEGNKLRAKLFTDVAPVDWIWVAPFAPVQRPEDDPAPAPDVPTPDDSAADAPLPGESDAP